MKSTDRLNKLKDMSDQELHDRRDEMSEEGFRLRFQWTMGQSEALNKIRGLRRDRARLLTVLRERELAKKVN